MKSLYTFMILCLTCSLFATSEIDPHKKCITYDQSGRLGNQLITYLCTKWIAKKNHLPFLYVSFPYSDQFLFHDQEKDLRSDWEKKFKNILRLKDISDIKTSPEGTLLVVNFFRFSSKAPLKYVKISYHPFWKSVKGRKYMRTLLKPKYPVNTLSPSKDRLNVVAHVRTGGGYDDLETQLRYPNKFPPHSFYIHSIEKLSNLFSHPAMYVYLMTDDLNPEAIAADYSKALAHLPNIIIDCHKGANGPSLNVLEDFFSIPKFDCLIRGSSTFAIAASLLGNFKAIASPKKSHVENGQIVIDEILIELQNGRYVLK